MHEQSLSPVCRIRIPACAMLWAMTLCEAMNEPDILTPLLEEHHDPRGNLPEATLVGLGILDTVKARHEIMIEIMLLGGDIVQKVRVFEAPCLQMR